MFQSANSTFQFPPIKKISTFQIKIFNFDVLVFDRLKGLRRHER